MIENMGVSTFLNPQGLYRDCFTFNLELEQRNHKYYKLISEEFVLPFANLDIARPTDCAVSEGKARRRREEGESAVFTFFPACT
jgi:hypothetical protein